MKKNKVLKIVLIVLGTLVALLAAAVLGVLLYLRSMAASLPETLPVLTRRDGTISFPR